MAPKRIDIYLPFPSSVLNGHNRGHWSSRSGPVKEARQEAAAIAAPILEAFDWPTPERCSFEILAIYFPDNSHRDTLNVVNAMKPQIDGLTDAGVLPDDNRFVFRPIMRETMVMETDKHDPRIVVMITDEFYGGKDKKISTDEISGAEIAADIECSGRIDSHPNPGKPDRTAG